MAGEPDLRMPPLYRDPHFDGPKLRRIHLNECGHPVPDENGVRGAQEIGRIAAKATKDDLVLFLVSGGASALK